MGLKENEIPTDKLEAVVARVQEATRRSGEHEAGKDQLTRIEDGVREVTKGLQAFREEVKARLDVGDLRMTYIDEKATETKRIMFIGMGLVLVGVLSWAGVTLLKADKAPDHSQIAKGSP